MKPKRKPLGGFLSERAKGLNINSKVIFNGSNINIANMDLGNLNSITLQPMDIANVVAHFKPFCVPVIYRNGSNVRIEFLKKPASKKLLTHKSATKRLAQELQALDLTIHVSEMGVAA